jgi:hypothetical protein
MARDYYHLKKLKKKKTMGKEKCECGKMAVWVYISGFGDKSNPYFCDDCVISPEDKIGCSCNWNYGKLQEGLPIDMPEGVEGKDWNWVEYEGDEYIDPISKEEGYWVYLDERGRPYPCFEYAYDEEGFDVPTFIGDLKYNLSLITESVKIFLIKMLWKKIFKK